MTPHEIANLRHPKAGAPTVQHLYHNIGGDVVLIANRFERRNGKSSLSPMM